MIERLRRTTLFVAYQAALALGIVVFPLALLTERAGLSLPVDTLVERLGEAHERTTDA
jgi:hypothetical protein